MGNHIADGTSRPPTPDLIGSAGPDHIVAMTSPAESDTLTSSSVRLVALSTAMRLGPVPPVMTMRIAGMVKISPVKPSSAHQEVSAATITIMTAVHAIKIR